jgi:hypothetical protein
VSSTSTNKQPLLVDRPLHSFVTLGPTACLSSATNYSSIVNGGCFELVNCIDTDGAVIDSISIMTTQAGTTAVAALLFVSSSPTPFGITDSNTALVASGTVSSALAGARVNISLPPLTIPVPSLGGMALPSEADKKNTGLYLPDGLVLYAGINTAIVAPFPTTKIHVFAQGGYF